MNINTPPGFFVLGCHN